MGVEAPSAEAVDHANSPENKYRGSAYLDEVNAVKAELRSAELEGRKPYLKDFHPTALEAAGVKVPKPPKAKVEKEPTKKLPVNKKPAKKASKK